MPQSLRRRVGAGLRLIQPASTRSRAAAVELTAATVAAGRVEAGKRPEVVISEPSDRRGRGYQAVVPFPERSLPLPSNFTLRSSIVPGSGSATSDVGGHSLYVHRAGV